MSEKNLVLVLVGHQGYIRHEHAADYAAENDVLFSAISHTYLPLIRMLQKLDAEGLLFKISLVLSPVLCALLADALVQEQYIDWLDARIALGERELVRCKNDASLLTQAQETLRQYAQDKADFCDVFSRNLIQPFAELAKKGHVELLATAGSYAFFPHYADMTEVLNAQVETGLYSHRRFFGTAPEGFWLPYLGYAHGVEKVLRSYGINYTILDTRSLLFSTDAVEKGIFAPVRCTNSLVVFARDGDCPAQITDEQTGFMHNAVYKNVNKDIGFDLGAEELGSFWQEGQARIQSGYRYYAKNDAVYDAAAALAQVQADARSFIAEKKAKLQRASEYLAADESPCLFCTLDVTTLGSEWAEGIAFLEQVIRASDGLTLSGGADLLENQFSLPKITPYPSAASGSGYGEDLLDSTNNWLLRHTRKMCERMVDLTGRFPDDTGLKARLLNLGAKELMIAQEAEWASMLHEGRFPEYVAERFKDSITAFIAVFDSLGSNTVSTEWLTSLERAHPLFPWMNYRIFSRKK